MQALDAIIYLTLKFYQYQVTMCRDINIFDMRNRRYESAVTVTNWAFFVQI